MTDKHLKHTISLLNFLPKGKQGSHQPHSQEETFLRLICTAYSSVAPELIVTFNNAHRHSEAMKIVLYPGKMFFVNFASLYRALKNLLDLLILLIIINIGLLERHLMNTLYVKISSHKMPQFFIIT